MRLHAVRLRDYAPFSFSSRERRAKVAFELIFRTRQGPMLTSIHNSGFVILCFLDQLSPNCDAKESYNNVISTEYLDGRTQMVVRSLEHQFEPFGSDFSSRIHPPTGRRRMLAWSSASGKRYPRIKGRLSPYHKVPRVIAMRVDPAQITQKSRCGVKRIRNQSIFVPLLRKMQCQDHTSR